LEKNEIYSKDSLITCVTLFIIAYLLQGLLAILLLGPCHQPLCKPDDIDNGKYSQIYGIIVCNKIGCFLEKMSSNSILKV